MVKLTPYLFEWIRLAEQDEKLAVFALKDSTLLEPACFHAQQLAEKYLKIFILFHNQRFNKTHNLTDLVQLCSQIDSDFNSLLTESDELTEFYIESRYPVKSSEITQKDAKKALTVAKRIKKFVVERLK
jgi:HEPN domain-containing protein